MKEWRNEERMIVIADDITGAAEIAGVAHSKGQAVCLVCAGTASVDTAPAGTVYGGSADTTAPATTVIATDTRSMTEAEAAAETRRIVSSCWGMMEGATLFKKTDSALRGHVVAELEALMQAAGYRRAVYLPANPTKGRVIRGGIYYINNTPIHETDFSFDPEFPARTSVLKERFPDAETKGIIMPDAESEEDIRNIIARYNDGHTLFAGAADLFGGMIGMGDERLENTITKHPTPISQSSNDTLILCGSTQSKPLDIGIPLAPMPRIVYDGQQTAADWYASLTPPPASLILTIPHTHRTGKSIAIHLRTVMAEMAKLLVEHHRPEHLIIEGGATAWATLQTLGWTQFEIIGQVAPGVVQMRAACGTVVTLKPGSYPWGRLMTQKNT